MESRMNDIYGVRNNVLTECEKVRHYVNIIQNKTDDVVSYIKQLSTSSFFKQYAPIYKYLHELNEKLVEQNCQFELFFLESEKFPSLNTNSCNNSYKLADLCSSVQHEENPETITVLNSADSVENAATATENIFDKSTNIKLNELKPTNDEPVTNQIENEEKNDERPLNAETLLEKINKRTQEKEQENNAHIPDLRPVVVTTDYYESSSSTSSDVCNPIKKPETKTWTPVHKKFNEAENMKTAKNIINTIEVKESPVPKEGELCFISHVESPSNFYIQVLSEDNTLIDYLSHQIEEILPCLKLFPTKFEAQKSIEYYCVCYIGQRKTWYRAKILNWLMENEELVSVQLIDYGNTCFIPLKNIREAIPYFFALHAMAIRCKLAWVKPPNNENNWPNKSIEYFHNMLNANDENLYYLSFVHQDRHILSIDLQNSDITSLAGDLIAAGIASDSNEGDNDFCPNKFMKNQVIHSQGFSKEELKMSEEEKMQKDFDYFDDDEEHTDPRLAVAHYAPRDETEICRIFLANGYCFKGNNCTFSHTPLNPGK